jgi:glycosyltransferase involved in cell wall biosynthesis
LDGFPHNGSQCLDLNSALFDTGMLKTMKILFVARTYPWPETNGTSIRAANLVRALARLGDVDLLGLTRRETLPPSLPASQPVARLALMSKPPSIYGGGRRLRWLTAERLPVEIATRDYSSVRSKFGDWARPQYDLVWMQGAESYIAIGPGIDAPSIVDFADLEDHKIAGRLRVDDGRLAPRARGRSVFRRWGSRFQTEVNLRRWHALQGRIAASVQTVTVCSRLDQERLGVSNSVVIPNGYTAPPRPAGRIEVGNPPTLLLVGTFLYRANLDAARWLVEAVLPRLRQKIPHIQIRLVGRSDHRLQALASEEVTLTGEVIDVDSELTRADVIVVPIRFGSGTRIKILEAFAHRIPVVSTSLGCEGIDAFDRRHLLVADDLRGFASACEEVLRDVPLRRSLVDAAHNLYWRKYRWDVISESVAELAAGVTRRGFSASGSRS